MKKIILILNIIFFNTLFASNQKAEPAIIQAVRQNNLNEIKRLIKLKTNVNVKNNKGYTPLMLAIFISKDMAQFLVDAGADVNAK
ncbi:MAG: ankyrin repeat domain-containing protein, partial [Spirochaetia bacterium]|nr:ankyrin repeat domain-containing protein [Spirochaetia bacterium]